MRSHEPTQAVTEGFIPRREILRLIGVSEPTLWRMERRGDFPAAVRISLRRVGYSAAAVQEWIASRTRVA
jgi:prophage regulatory protein